MIERQFVSQKIKEFQIKEYMSKVLAKAGYSHTEIHRTPLGEKVVIFTTRPGLVVGKKGDNIKRLTLYLKKKYKLENPQIEIGEVTNPMLDVHYVADRIAYSLERFGSKRFKSVGYKVLQDIMNAGAIGAEVVLSGKIPSARARSWRFSAGYLKKSGDIAENKIKKSIAAVNLKSGTIGIKVSIMTPDIVLPDKLLVHEQKKELKQPEPEIEKAKAITTDDSKKEVVEEAKEEKPEKEKAEPKAKKAMKTTKIKEKDGADKKKRTEKHE